MRQAVYWRQLEDRLIDWVGKALKRKPRAEARAAGSLRVASGVSPRVRKSLVEVTSVLVERGSFERPLYAASVRALADAGDRQLPKLLGKALRTEGGGGLATLAAATRCPAAKLEDALVRVAASRHPDMAFGAALVCGLRGGGRAPQLLGAAAKLKESARIALCTQLIVPLMEDGGHEAPMPAAIAPAMRVLRDAERHLGRWLIFAKAGLASGDDDGLRLAQERAGVGSKSARTAWGLLAWALDPAQPMPDVRVTAEVVTRLSDRPTAEKDMSFLFRMSDDGAEGARALLESLSKPPLRDALQVRAAGALARRYDRVDATANLRELVEGPARVDLKGIGVAALYDTGAEKEAKEGAAGLIDARNVGCAVWGGLVLRGEVGTHGVVSEARFRQLERGLVQ